MKNAYSFPRLWLVAILLLANVFAAQAQVWNPASPVTVCPGQTGSYTLSGIPAGSRIRPGFNPGDVVGGTLQNSPTLSSGSIT